MEGRLERLLIEHYTLAPSEAKCSTCRFFDPIEGLDELVGYCRSASPVIDMVPIFDEDKEIEEGFTGDPDMGVITLTSISQTDITKRGVWPQVSNDDWCGEWRLHPRVRPS